MHPDAPEWARELLAREMPSADLRRFVVLKDGPVQKLAFAYADDGLYVVQRTVAGGEIFHVAWGAAGARARCATCGAAFRFEGDVRALHCVACGARIAPREDALPLPDLASLTGAEARALEDAGVRDVEDLARRDPDSIAAAVGVPAERALAWIEAARGLR